MIASAHAARGLLVLRRNDAGAALLSLEAAIISRPAPEGSDYLRLGEALVMKGDPERAREAFARAESLGPAIVTQAARQHAASIQKSDAGSVASLVALARALEKEGKLQPAAAYESVIRETPKLAEAYHDLGLIYYRLGDYRNLSATCGPHSRLNQD